MKDITKREIALINQRQSKESDDEKKDSWRFRKGIAHSRDKVEAETLMDTYMSEILRYVWIAHKALCVI
jgi:hypothetical protein